MQDFQQRKKVRKILSGRAAFLVLLIVTILLVRGVWGVFEKERESSLALIKARESLAAADSREQELSTNIERLKTPQGLEREIRDRFSVAKSGEEIILIVDQKKEVELETDTRTVWEKIGDWFGEVF